jgi:ABC-2 type transport system permease protein
MFWTLVFPLALALFFNLAFGNFNYGDSFRAFPICVVDNEELRSEPGFRDAIDSVSDENAGAESQLFRVSYTSEEEAIERLKNNAIVGYILFDKGAHVAVKNTGIRQTILKSFVDTYLQTASAYKQIVSKNPSQAMSLVTDSRRSFIVNERTNGKTANNTLVNFYALLSMAVLFGGFFGQKEVDDIQANLTSQGARINIAPVAKMKYFLFSMSSALLVQFISLVVLVTFLNVVLKVDLGGQLWYVLLVCLLGSMAGISFGALVGSLFRGGKGTAVLISVSMLLSSAAGLQAPILKYMIAEKAPILAYLNPANLITDAFYSLYYYTDHTRYYLNMALLAAFTAVFFTVVILVTKKKTYKSI